MRPLNREESLVSPTLQELVEDLAQQLNAPAVIEDDELRMVAYSPHGVLKTTSAATRS